MRLLLILAALLCGVPTKLIIYEMVTKTPLLLGDGRVLDTQAKLLAALALAVVGPLLLLGTAAPSRPWLRGH